jgi:hypothetical protein
LMGGTAEVGMIRTGVGLVDLVKIDFHRRHGAAVFSYMTDRRRVECPQTEGDMIADGCLDARRVGLETAVRGRDRRRAKISFVAAAVVGGGKLELFDGVRADRAESLAGEGNLLSRAAV